AGIGWFQGESEANGRLRKSAGAAPPCCGPRSAMGAPGSCGSCAPAPGFGEPPGLPTIGPVSPPTTEPLPPPTIVPLSPPRPAPLEGTWALLPDGAEVPIRSTAEPGRETPGSLPATGAPGSCGSCAPAPGFGEPPGLP